MAGDAMERLTEVVRASGLIEPGSRGVAMLSGGPDSACLAAGLAGAIGAGQVTGCHVNYGIRHTADRDQRLCEQLCEGLGVELRSVRVDLDTAGNVQEAARDTRYEIAEELRAGTRGYWIATGHTRTDLAETVLYRLASSPGRRALLGLPPRRGRVVRPLLGIGRAEARSLATEAGLPFGDDPTNLDARFARVRLREEVLPVLRELNPGAERNIGATRAELEEEAAALEALAAEALEAANAAGGPAAGVGVVQVEALRELHPAIRRLALRQLAERVTGSDVTLGPDRAGEIWRLARSPEGGAVDLGAGVKAICEAGTVRIVTGEEALPAAARLPVPGRCRFGRWEVEAKVGAPPPEPWDPDVAVLDPAAVGAELEVRAWREGDRMRPIGMSGTKSLQDLFTDRRVPRSLRRTLPVVTAGDRIAWVAGVAVSEDFRAGQGGGKAALLSARIAG